ncbi:polysaccharide deacetylase family protein [Kaistia dalseonensis]|uniref:Chitooligosaccharide deacetylase n=1 Tax=Kaistia dalseonensis TaxID=410840 RepID=A0ABU0H1M6_9HYPH|nr:polysaccharide deacetylase family protein [Kaistia dalseonensis]MCX5493644.1 polysaccharide deacetylase family protein [Kaistia dalseonensis]MDQ0436206.1 peptidoglycan/xylan/chitin deacetylase (PgdA/CDA1 family) [Kaistia dalseonensis]
MQGLRSLGVKAGLNALYWSGAHRLLSARTEGAGAILMFHHVRPARGDGFRPNDHLEVTPDFLRSVVERLRARDIDIVDMDEALRRLGEGRRARRFAVLTFDDGYRNNIVEAYPVLKALEAPFTVYVATGLVDREASPWWDVIGAVIAQNDRIDATIEGARLALTARTSAEKAIACDRLICALVAADEDEQRRAVSTIAIRHGVDIAAMLDREMMDWADISRLAADPLVTIGAHTVGHYALARLDAARARDEMRESRERIAAILGERPRHFAYPYGSALTAGEREFAMAAELGFTSAVTTRRGVLRAGGGQRLTALPRISINGRYQSIRYLDLFLSGLPYVLEAGFHRLSGGGARSAARAAFASTR